jgi:hypothetical protein
MQPPETAAAEAWLIMDGFPCTPGLVAILERGRSAFAGVATRSFGGRVFFANFPFVPA